LTTNQLFWKHKVYIDTEEAKYSMPQVNEGALKKLYERDWAGAILRSAKNLMKRLPCCLDG
jgi:hypothetical protein